MATFQSRLDALGFTRDEAAYIKNRVKQYLDDGHSPSDAQTRAVRELLEETKTTRQEVLNQIFEALPADKRPQVFPEYQPPAITKTKTPTANKEKPMKQSWRWVVRGTLKNVGVPEAPRLNEESLDDLTQKIRAFVNGLDTPEFINYLEEVYPEYFVYCTRKADCGLMSSPDGTQTDGRMFKRAYTWDAATGAITIGDSPIEVKEETTYVQVSPPNANTTNNREQEISALKKELIDKIVANARAPYQESNRAALETLEDCQLTKILATYEEPATAPTTNAPTAPVETAPVKVPTLQDLIEASDPAARDAFNAVVNQAKAQEASLREKLLANKDCPFSKEELEGKNLVELTKLAALAKVNTPAPDFSANAGAGGNTTNANNPPAMPKPVFGKTAAA